MKQIKHKHHIIPKHLGGFDIPENIVLVTPAEHAEAHLALFMMHRKREDYIAYLGLSGMIGKEKITLELQKLNGERVGRSNKNKASWNKGISMSEDQKKKISIAKKGQKAWNKNKKHDDVTKQKIKSVLTGRNLSQGHKANLTDWYLITWIDTDKLPTLVFGSQGGSDAIGKSKQTFFAWIKDEGLANRNGVKSIVKSN